MKDKTESGASDTSHQDENFPLMRKELSWLSFNDRVLQEAADPKVPVIQRMRYLGIFSNNLDEFFRVRVAEVRRLAAFDKLNKQDTYVQLLADIKQRVLKSQRRFESIYQETLRELRKRKIYMVDEKKLDENQTEYVRNYFVKHIQPALAPIILDDQYPIPTLNELSIYLAVRLNLDNQPRYALLEVPTERLKRFVRIPSPKDKQVKVLIALENIIRVCLLDVFRGVFVADSAEAYTIKLTRDAELELGEEITESFFAKMSQSLKKRSKGDPVRFVYDSEMPDDLLNYLNRRLNLGRFDSVIPGGRYHNSKDFMSFPNLGAAYLDMKPLSPIPVPEIEKEANIFDAISKRDILLYYPYHDFVHISDLLRTAAIDPRVQSINISLYRVASDSTVIDALISAVANHKQVTVVIELQARFDEEANIHLSRRLIDGGVNVVFGVPGLKVHSKIILISRQEGKVKQYYAHIGTGNFNEKTANLYTDFSLLTKDQKICNEVSKVFDFINHTYRRHNFTHLAVSPLNSKNRFLEKIEGEIHHAKKGRSCGITIKCNNLVDPDIIAKLYKASQAGVPVRVIVRGMCSLVPGIKGVSDNIEAISIVDRFLEHPRVFVFRNGGNPLYYISSADLMTRNLEHRVEVTCPIYDKQNQKMIQKILDIQWSDNIKARIIDVDQSNQMRTRKQKSAKIRSQILIHDYLTTGKTPRMAKLKYRRIK